MISSLLNILWVVLGGLVMAHGMVAGWLGLCHHHRWTALGAILAL